MPRDLGVGVPEREEAKNLGFLRCESADCGLRNFLRRPRRERNADRRLQVKATACNGTDAGEEIGLGRRLQHVTVGSGREDLLHGGQVVECRQREDRGVSETAVDAFDDLHSSGVGEREIGHHNVWFDLEGHERRKAGCLADDIEVGLLVDERTEPFSKHRLVVEEGQTDDRVRRFAHAMVFSPLPPGNEIGSLPRCEAPKRAFDGGLPQVRGPATSAFAREARSRSAPTRDHSGRFRAAD